MEKEHDLFFTILIKLAREEILHASLMRKIKPLVDIIRIYG